MDIRIINRTLMIDGWYDIVRIKNELVLTDACGIKSPHRETIETEGEMEIVKNIRNLLRMNIGVEMDDDIMPLHLYANIIKK